MKYGPAQGHIIRDENGRAIAFVHGRDTYRLEIPLAGEELVEVFMNQGNALPIMPPQ